MSQKKRLPQAARRSRARTNKYPWIVCRGLGDLFVVTCVTCGIGKTIELPCKTDFSRELMSFVKQHKRHEPPPVEDQTPPA